MIYLLEDDANIRKLVRYALKNNGMDAEAFAVPHEFWEAVRKEKPQLILLDVMLPEEDGLSILEKLRAAADTRKVPIILLTAKGSEFDKVTGLDLGADDYIAKPFGMMELISRIRALLRRTQEDGDYTDTVGELSVCPAKHIVRASGVEVTLALKEYELLCMLLEADGKVCKREQIQTQVWGYAAESRTVDVHIRKLRQKLGEAGACIETVKGVGYQIRRDEEQAHE
ncbi:MAG: response regulator transcription factor [Evtepia sp.]